MRPWVALLLCASTARAAGPSPLWEDVAHPNRPRCAQIATDLRRATQSSPSSLNGAQREALSLLLAKGLRLCPKDIEMLTLAGDLQLRFFHEPVVARTLLEQARALAPAGEDHDPLLALSLGLTRSIAGELESGLTEYRRAESLGGLPQSWRVPYNIGDNLMALGRLGEAIHAYRRALRLAPHAVNARFALAVALDRDGQANLSREELLAALARDHRLQVLFSDEFYFIPPADHHYYLALVNRVRGRPIEAQKELTEFLRLAPDGPYAARARELWESLSP